MKCKKPIHELALLISTQPTSTAFSISVDVLLRTLVNEK
jgi:hypothetical protein